MTYGTRISGPEALHPKPGTQNCDPNPGTSAGLSARCAWTLAPNFGMPFTRVPKPEFQSLKSIYIYTYICIYIWIYIYICIYTYISVLYIQVQNPEHLPGVWRDGRGPKPRAALCGIPYTIHTSTVYISNPQPRTWIKKTRNPKLRPEPRNICWGVGEKGVTPSPELLEAVCPTSESRNPKLYT